MLVANDSPLLTFCLKHSSNGTKSDQNLATPPVLCNLMPQEEATWTELKTQHHDQESHSQS